MQQQQPERPGFRWPLVAEAAKICGRNCYSFREPRIWPVEDVAIDKMSDENGVPHSPSILTRCLAGSTFRGSDKGPAGRPAAGTSAHQFHQRTAGVEAFHCDNLRQQSALTDVKGRSTELRRGNLCELSCACWSIRTVQTRAG